MRTDLLDIIDKRPRWSSTKKEILCIIPINRALQPIDGRTKYSVANPDPYSEYGWVNLIRIWTAVVVGPWER